MRQMITLALSLLLSMPAQALALPTSSIPTDGRTCLADIQMLLKQRSGSGPGQGPSSLDRCLLDAGEATLIPIKAALAGANSPEALERISGALAHIGGVQSVSMLRELYNVHPTVGIRAALCFALASTGTADDRKFLIEALQGKHFGGEWYPLVAAAYSLGVLRASEAKPALRASAGMKAGFASFAAEDALEWMEKGDRSVKFEKAGGVDDEVIAAIVANGLPRLNESPIFVEGVHQRVWRIGSSGDWTVGSFSHGEDVPSVGFQVVRSKDGMRAIVSVTLYFGILNANGFDYFLERSDHWRVRCLVPTWES
jgi:hypothetical protein